jgi:hypothetical protein
VSSTREAVIVERKGKPIAAIVSPDQLDEIERFKARVWRTIEAVGERNADQNPDDEYREVTSVVEQVRQQRHDAQVRATTGRG